MGCPFAIAIPPCRPDLSYLRRAGRLVCRKPVLDRLVHAQNEHRRSFIGLGQELAKPVRPKLHVETLVNEGLAWNLQFFH